MDKLAEMFAAVATKYGPQVTDAALGAVRVEAYSDLVSAGMFSVASAALGYGAYRLFKWAKAEKQTRYGDGDLQILFGFLVGAASLFAGIVGLWTFIDPWTWVALYHPELWLAKQALKIG